MVGVAGGVDTHVTSELLRLFPQSVLRGRPRDFKEHKRGVPLTAAQQKALMKLRRKEMACVYTSNKRAIAAEKSRQVCAQRDTLRDRNQDLEQENASLRALVAHLKAQILP